MDDRNKILWDALTLEDSPAKITVLSGILYGNLMTRIGEGPQGIYQSFLSSVSNNLSYPEESLELLQLYMNQFIIFTQRALEVFRNGMVSNMAPWLDEAESEFRKLRKLMYKRHLESKLKDILPPFEEKEEEPEKPKLEFDVTIEDEESEVEEDSKKPLPLTSNSKLEEKIEEEEEEEIERFQFKQFFKVDEQELNSSKENPFLEGKPNPSPEPLIEMKKWREKQDSFSGTNAQKKEERTLLEKSEESDPQLNSLADIRLEEEDKNVRLIFSEFSSNEDSRPSTPNLLENVEKIETRVAQQLNIEEISSPESKKRDSFSSSPFGSPAVKRDDDFTENPFTDEDL